MSGDWEQALDPVISWASLTFFILFKSPVMGGDISYLLKEYSHVCIRSIPRENTKFLCLEDELTKKAPILITTDLSTHFII